MLKVHWQLWKSIEKRLIYLFQRAAENSLTAEKADQYLRSSRLYSHHFENLILKE